MRKLLLALIVIIPSGCALAQYVPSSNQGYQYLALYNPGFSGIENFTDIKLSYLYQWANLPTAPKTINLTISQRLNQPVDLSNSSLRPSSTANVSNPVFIPRRKRIFHAIGGNAFNQTYGPLVISGGGLNYAIHYPLSKKIRLSGGVAGIIESIKIDPSSIDVRDAADPYMAFLQNNNVKQTNLNVRAGLVLYGKNFYFGLSYFPILNKTIAAGNRLGSSQFYKGSVQMGYSFAASSSLTLKPSILGMLQMNNKLTADYSIKAYIQNKLMLGFGYRDIQSGVVYLGMNINEFMSFNYSYEISAFVSSTMEVMNWYWHFVSITSKKATPSYGDPVDFRRSDDDISRGKGTDAGARAGIQRAGPLVQQHQHGCRGRTATTFAGRAETLFHTCVVRRKRWWKI